MIDRVTTGNELYAIIIPQHFTASGVHFFTPDNFSQQLAYMNHPQGKQIEPHVHNPVPRAVTYTQEVLFIKKGRLRVDFFDHQQNLFDSRILGPGDVILLVAGGHGFEVLEDTEMIEVKQGPYVGEADKTRFTGISAQILDTKKQ